MSIKQINPSCFMLDCRVWIEGIEFRRRETFEGGKKAAAARFREIKAELRENAQKKDTRSLILKLKNFGEALDRYYEVKKNNLVSLSSFQRMRRDLGDVSIIEIRERFKMYWINLQRTRSRQTGGFLAASTVNHYTVMAKAALNMCVKDGLLDSNPLRHIKILKVIPREVTLSELDRQRLLNVIDREAPHLSYIVRFALSVPSRKSELLNMKREDLDLINNTVWVRHENAKGDNGSWKPIPPELIDYFRTLPNDTEYLFFRRDFTGRAVKLGNFRRSFTRCLKIARLTGFHFHDTRAISATNLLNAGNPEQVVCQVAGWKSGNMIKTYYRKDGLQAAQSIVFPPKNCQKTGHLTGHLQAVNS